VAPVRADVSGEPSTSIVSVTRISELDTDARCEEIISENGSVIWRMQGRVVIADNGNKPHHYLLANYVYTLLKYCLNIVLYISYIPEIDVNCGTG
jgi:hypothetical protein